MTASGERRCSPDIPRVGCDREFSRDEQTQDPGNDGSGLVQRTGAPSQAQNVAATPATPTREFEIRNDRPFLGGQPVRLWGVRCGQRAL